MGLYTMHNAEWLVETWVGEAVKEQLAYCKSFACAEAAYLAALEAMPFDRIIFRHGGRTIKERPATKWKPKRAARLTLTANRTALATG